jgi:hypothetical protein
MFAKCGLPDRWWSRIELARHAGMADECLREEPT